MRFYKNAIILTILFSYALFVAGLCTFHILTSTFLPKVEGGFYPSVKYGDDFIGTLIFSLTIGLTPFIILQTWRLSPIVPPRKKITSVFVILFCMILAMLLRQQILKSYFRAQTKNFTSAVDQIKVSYPVEQLNFEYYILGGLIAGCFISYLLLRKK